MTEEEKESIEEFRKQLRLAINIDDVTTAIRNDNAQIILNLIEKLQKENEQLRTEVNSLKKDISNMYDEEVIISIISDNFNLSRNEVLKLLGGE